MNKPIRVLQVFAEMNRGGAETMIMSLYRNIDRDKIQFDFIVHTNEKCAYDDEIERMGGNIYRLSKYTLKNHKEYIQSWIRFFKEHPEYKVIHGHVRSTAAMYLNIAKRYNLITIAHSHNTSSGTGVKAMIKNTMQLPIKNIADYLFACSDDAGRWLFGKKSLEKDNYIVLKNAINTKDFVFNESVRKSKRDELGLNGKFVIGHVGRFHPQKNHNKLIDIFKEIYNINNNAVLLLVGDGELRSKITKKIETLGLETSVIFTGARSDIAELYQAMDVFVFPSLFEGLGIVAIEAQASGLPCIVADVIPDEARVTNDFLKMKSTDSVKEWALEINKYQGFIRKNNFKSVEENGYDIIETASWLENFYKQFKSL